MAAHSRGIFQSTFPLQGTTVIDTVQYTGLKFQSTFPLQGTTMMDSLTKRGFRDFNPRSHCRERRLPPENLLSR
ncbi:hypothetical protein CLOSCI_01561 [[Clostridium] scindens ATCC 35704]|nr:hypothetical protein CLOSCI_01561 [[Clostridium] scindens ATCC 35704]